MIFNFKKKYDDTKEILEGNQFLRKIYSKVINKQEFSISNFTTFDHGVEKRLNKKYIQAAVLVPIIFKKKNLFYYLPKDLLF
tara:strand:+ start:1743 stop:1988 length:246 start_codon:yes stop_codon:yes gene_type:complete